MNYLWIPCDEEERPILKVFVRVLTEQINYSHGVFSLRHIINQMRYWWTYAKISKKILIEKHDFRNARIRYIKK